MIVLLHAGLPVSPSSRDRRSYCAFPSLQGAIPCRSSTRRTSLVPRLDTVAQTPASGTGRRPPGDQQSIQTRRAVVAVALLIVVILMALGVHSCQVSASNSALKDYTNSVSSLITQSDETGTQLFQDLSSGGSSTDATSVQEQINQTRQKALGELQPGPNLGPPDEVKSANLKLLLRSGCAWTGSPTSPGRSSLPWEPRPARTRSLRSPPRPNACTPPM